MKIVSLTVENFKRVRAIHLIPDPNSNIITGNNGQGKTSVIDSICALFNIKDLDLPEPIRQGAEKSKIIGKTEDYVVTRWWTSNENSYLRVEALDGSEIKSPQKLLDKFVGGLAFDPVRFMNLSDKEQITQLLSVVPIDINLEQIEFERKDHYDKRTLVNREVVQLEAQMKDQASPSTKEMETEKDSKNILDALVAANQQTRENNKKRDDLVYAKKSLGLNIQKKAQLQDQIEAMRRQIEEIKRKIEVTESQIVAQDESIESQKKAIERQEQEVQLLQSPDTTNLESSLKLLETENAEIRSRNAFRQKLKLLGEKKLESQKYTDAIETLYARKREAIGKAQFPIKDLSFDETGLVYRGIPLKQCSSSEVLKVSTAIAMALNPSLKVILIRDGSLLDDASMAMLQELAKTKDYQLWIERVDGSGKIGIYIEDGEIVNTVK